MTHEQLKQAMLDSYPERRALYDALPDPMTLKDKAEYEAECHAAILRAYRKGMQTDLPNN